MLPSSQSAVVSVPPVSTTAAGSFSMQPSMALPIYKRIARSIPSSPIPSPISPTTRTLPESEFEASFPSWRRTHVPRAHKALPRAVRRNSVQPLTPAADRGRFIPQTSRRLTLLSPTAKPVTPDQAIVSVVPSCIGLLPRPKGPIHPVPGGYSRYPDSFRPNSLWTVIRCRLVGRHMTEMPP